MSRPLQRLAAVLVAFLLAVNVAGAASPGGPGAACCGGGAAHPPAPRIVAPPCAGDTSALSCAQDAAPDAAAGTAARSACDDACAHCLAHAGSTPAVLLAMPQAHAALPVAYERPQFAEHAMRPAPLRRLERPPAASPRD